MGIDKANEAYNLQLIQEKKYDEWIILNQTLLYYFQNKYYNYLSDADETMSQIYMALFKAFKTFKVEKEIRFTTYLDRCIVNELLMEIRRRKRQGRIETISMEEILFSGRADDKPLTLEDTIASNENVEEFVAQKIYAEEIVDIILDKTVLNHKEMHAIKLFYEGTDTQQEMAKKLNVSQSYVSRLRNNAGRKIEKTIKHRKALFLAKELPVQSFNQLKNNTQQETTEKKTLLSVQEKTPNIKNKLSFVKMDVKGAYDYSISAHSISLNDKTFTHEEWVHFMKEIEELNLCIQRLREEEFILNCI